MEMQPDAAAFATLGLTPDEGPAAIEAAYRRLIKACHPDRGGDPDRAAEINSAYQHLRRRFGDELGRRRNFPVQVRTPRPARRGRGRLWRALLVAGAAGLLLSRREDLAGTIAGLSLPVVQPLRASAESPPGRMPADLDEAPLDLVAIDRSVIDAAQSAATGGEGRLERQSLACHAQLRRDPEPSRFDRCVAFDEAAVAMLGRDPFAAGAFGASAVTARHFASGHLLSSDTLAVEARLNRIRHRVELSLAPPDPLPPAPAQAAN